MQLATNETVLAIGEIHQAIGQLNEVSGLIDAAVTTQGCTTREITAALQRATSRNDDVTALTATIQTENAVTVSVASHLTMVTDGLTEHTNALLKASACFVKDARVPDGNVWSRTGKHPKDVSCLTNVV